MAQFTEMFDVEEKGSNWPATYRRLMQELRGRQGVRYSHNRPVLPQENPPKKWFDILLRSSSSAIRLRIRLGNLYLDGYQMQNPNQCLEFGYSPPPEHLIPGSTFLGFDGGYDDLQRAQKEMEKIYLGRRELKRAVNQLAASTSRKDRARHLIVVIQMICESIRFERISEHLATQFPESSRPPSWMLALARLGRALCRVAARR
ncbi:rRNA N-glycosidase [Cocos nucifera]|uniref:rRNA N-glycosylase n=1 Tax=Cocos nucifera TaxID=13894 RepID=A0A8K0N5P7_COCNU|nr:rRNA N-glycosidase [Cocos nucifera]